MSQDPPPSPTGRLRLPLPERPIAELHTHRVLAEPGAGSGPVLVLLGVDFASIELRLLAAGLAREGAEVVLLAVEPPRQRAADLVDVRELVASLHEPEPVQGPITERCKGCHGRGSVFVGRGPQPCRRCGGSGKVLVR
jgi:hypothetical protein